MSVRIEEVSDLADAHALRRAVFIEEQRIPEAEEWDDLDAGAIHLVAYVDGAPAGTARLLLNGSTAAIGRVVVLSPYRGTGLGARLIAEALERLRALPGVTRVTLGAQTHALGFYGRFGFVAEGPGYDDGGIPHRTMTLDLQSP
ncbi:GNAT family N-acetyltransferase [Roseivivax sediminis]|uniref:Predicted N-acyltransferase, GNAT family n=1 Tax=Roseivivax sediminis TaxID=936889 RepID=A0A1I1UT36_9RHOB|nr:GNAT family N-acetyltransferase [Roseivivax sediminis]SFD71150.1 Predicted N-acyltransferase, GNAT family [Roseivivax sediminis]